MVTSASGGTQNVIDLESFRSKVCSWLAENAERYPRQANDPASGRKFRRALWDAGLLGITLDPAYEGQGLTDEYQKVFNEEVSRYDVPPIGEAVTTGICAPTLLTSGPRSRSAATSGR